MNLTRALEVALPDIPARKLAESYPRLDPGTSSREHIEDGRPMVRVYVPACSGMYSLDPEQWRLAQLFDGTRSYAEIAEIYSQENNIEYDEASVREFADALEANTFWYKTPQEKNILLLKQSKEERKKRLEVRSRWADLSDVTFPAFNPDRFLTWFYGKTKFVYTPWFTILSLIGIGIGAGISASHWSEIWQDTLDFYTFANKTWWDVFALYTLGMFVVGVHEFAHAHTCKHYGGRVPAMGFALVYLTPAFYTDTTEGFVQGSRYQRFVIAMAGIWSELILCAIATPIWWATPPQTLVHDSAHFIMMMTGLMSLLLNWNPLMKLDGYYMLCEVVGIRDLKEDSTAYVSAWVRSRIWRLPVDMPYVPKGRRLGYIIYALLSGFYSYSVLYILARFAGNFVRNFSPEWGFIPELAVAAIIFRSRIRLLGKFMKFIYLDKKDRVIAWFTPQHSLLAASAVAVLLALPIWHDSIAGRFMLESPHVAIVRAHVPGVVESIKVREGEQVSAGQSLGELRNLRLTSGYEAARAQFLLASERAKEASREYKGFGAALKEKEQQGAQVRQYSEMDKALELSSPIDGTVVTPRAQDLSGVYLNPGQQLLEVADLSALRARIYVPEHEMYKLQPGARARLQVDGFLRKWTANSAAIGARPVEMPGGLSGNNGLNGVSPLHFYLVDLEVANQDFQLRPGMTGMARIYGQRRSLAGLGWEWTSNFWGRKLW
ncbi:MAG TPA: efflux RND transporter periplasmic adaptor subunit [Candidatus Baltobacteraceae bacterium]|nr:efflux RND transporter periplasmic adaptor subunit [Candidatus Baltobacteraceae bacterium]